MAAPQDAANQMEISSGDDSDQDVPSLAHQTASTPSTLATSKQQVPTPALSPPGSQRRPSMPTSASGTAHANANGKRPINTISNGADDAEELAAMHANGKARQDFPVKTHERSGYSWGRAEEEPGYAWLNKKALDEAHRAWEGMVHKDVMVRERYGDIFEVVEKERAVLNSLKQQ